MRNNKNIKWELEEYSDAELLGLRVLDKENGETLFDTGLKGCIYEEEEENAKLISAAPEMLKMLTESMLELHPATTSGDGLYLSEKIKKLIKKATE